MEQPNQNPAAQNEREWVDAQVILQMLKICKDTLKGWRKHNVIVHSKIGGKIFYDKKDLLAKLDRNKKGGSGEE